MYADADTGLGTLGRNGTVVYMQSLIVVIEEEMTHDFGTSDHLSKPCVELL